MKIFFSVLILVLGLFSYFNLKDYFPNIHIITDYLKLNNTRPNIETIDENIASSTLHINDLYNNIKSGENEERLKKRELIVNIIHQNYKLMTYLVKIEVLVQNNKNIDFLISLLSLNEQSKNIELINKIINLAHEYSTLNTEHTKVIFPNQNKLLHWLKYFLMIEKKDPVNAEQYSASVENLLKAIENLKERISNEVLIKTLINEL